MITTPQIHWAAGFIEGEGNFSAFTVKGGHYFRVSASQVQREPLDRLRAIFGGALRLKDRPRDKPKWNSCWIWKADGVRAVGVMMTLYQLMSPKRQQAIHKCLTQWRTRLPHTRYRTHCPKGHPYVEGNIFWGKRTNVDGTAGSWRRCLTCKRDEARQSKYRKRHG